MSADRARLTHFPPRKYREVVSQQGRVLLEADVNEWERISTEETRHEAADFVGPCGTPDNGYQVTAAGGDFSIGVGTMYVGGLRTTLEVAENYSAQPDWLDTVEVAPWAEGLWQSLAQLAGKNFEATLVLREQEITAVEDPALRDVALGGPDSAARSRLLQRVVAVDTQSSTCAAAAGDVSTFWSAHGLDLDPATAALKSRARLQVTPVTNAPPPTPCDPPSATGYLGADNQLIRVLITAFDPATNTGTFLWGYYNASILYRCMVQTPLTVKLAARPVSPEFQPRSGQVVQILQRAADLGEGAFAASLTGHFAKLNAPYAPDTQLVTLPAALPQPPYANGSNVYLRLWEDQVNFTLGTAADLAGTGLQVTITETVAGPLHIGDYWSMAARPLTPNTVYPERLLAAPQPPDGPRMWACPLAVLQGNAGSFTVLDDCRFPFDNLVDLTARKSGDCCCIKVTPAQSKNLQAIVDQAAAAAGAQVIIEMVPGTYALPRPLRVTGKHKGLVLQACTGGKVVLRAAEQNSEFFLGLIVAIDGAQLTLRGLDLELPMVVTPQEMLVEIRKELSKLKWAPKEVCFGVRAAYCDSLVVEDCYFQFPTAEETYGAGIFVQGDTGVLAVRRCQFFGPPQAVRSVWTGVLSAPLVLAPQSRMRPTSINLAKIEDCLFGFLTIGVLLACDVRYAWARGNNARAVYGGFYLIRLTEQFERPSLVMSFVPPKALDPKGVAKAMIAQLMVTQEFSRSLGVAMAVGMGTLTGVINKDAVREKPVTLGDLAVSGNPNFPPVPGSPEPSLCLTLEGNQFDCRPVLDPLDSIAAVFLWDTNAGSCSANLTGNSIWNRSSSSPALVVVTLAVFNITGNALTSEQSGTAAGRATGPFALWAFPAPAIPNSAKVPVNLMTVTGNTIFGQTNLKELPRTEWKASPGLPAALDTWEFFNSIVT
jgi:hypothetical protein